MLKIVTSQNSPTQYLPLLATLSNIPLDHRLHPPRRCQVPTGVHWRVHYPPPQVLKEQAARNCWGIPPPPQIFPPEAHNPWLRIHLNPRRNPQRRPWSLDSNPPRGSENPSSCHHPRTSWEYIYTMLTLVLTITRYMDQHANVNHHTRLRLISKDPDPKHNASVRLTGSIWSWIPKQFLGHDPERSH